VLFKGVEARQAVWFSHGDTVSLLPQGFVATASTVTCPIAAMEDPSRKLFAVQFHVEVAHTPNGSRILRNFAFGPCGENGDYRAADTLPTLLESLKHKIGGERAIIGISGGVDSLVAATILDRAIGSQLHCIFIDTGLLRKGEVQEVSAFLSKRGFAHLHVIDAKDKFLSGLVGVVDPEEKRKIIGHTFIQVFHDAAREIDHSQPIRFLAQGTIYPDRIESAQPSKYSSKIKSHHNLTLPEGMKLQVVEPLGDFYKDEVRALGLKLGIPKELVWRHPFPGPGLAIRILGEVTPERLAILREADAIFIGELRESGWYEKVWQAFAALLSVKSVGVMGDSRTYDYIITLRAVESVDGMTADWIRLPPPLLEKISSRIVNEVRGANRVLYDVTQKPPGTIEYE
jgi:GMP synthase (glutamine-hydrolysing)